MDTPLLCVGHDTNPNWFNSSRRYLPPSEANGKSLSVMSRMKEANSETIEPTNRNLV